MSYKENVNGLLRVLGKINGFSKQNMTKADYRVLNVGTNQAIVLFPGPFSVEDSTLGNQGDFWIDWEISIELFVRYTSEPDVAERIAALRQSIIEQVAQYPFLDGTTGVFRAWVKKGDRPTPVFTPTGDGPYFWRQVLTCIVREDLSTIVTAE